MDGDSTGDCINFVSVNYRNYIDINQVYPN